MKCPKESKKRKNSVCVCEEKRKKKRESLERFQQCCDISEEKRVCKMRRPF